MAKKISPSRPRGALWRGGGRGHILNCGKTATNACIIMLRLSLAKPGNSASIYTLNNFIARTVPLLNCTEY